MVQFDFQLALDRNSIYSTSKVIMAHKEDLFIFTPYSKTRHDFSCSGKCGFFVTCETSSGLLPVAAREEKWRGILRTWSKR